MILVDLSQVDEEGLDLGGESRVLRDGQKAMNIIAMWKCTEIR